MGIAALGMVNVNNQYTFGTLFQRERGSKGDGPRRRRIVAIVILRWLEPVPAV